jgi:hypothetical protein
MGTAYVGDLGLLQQLELRSGRPALTASDVERETDYLNFVKSHMAGSPFEEAFRVDDLGVAGRLLAWRDALLMAGWDGTCTDPQARKLYTLAQIEADFRGGSMGEADRWVALYHAFQSGYYLREQIEEIQVDTPWQELPCLIRRTLEAIEQQGVTLTRLEEKEQTMQPKKYRVVSFPQLLQAYEWAATAQWPAGTAVVNRDNTLLNHVLYTWDKPRVHASFTQSNPQLTQLFKLGISIFSRPLNIQNLTSYLLLPEGPIPGKLRRQLADQLIADGGFGENDKWDDLIRKYTFINKEGKETPQSRAQKMKFLTPIRENYEKGIPREDLTGYISALRQWVQSHFAMADLPDALRMQYQELQAQLAAFSTALSTMPDSLQYADIEKLVLRIYRPMSYSLQPAEQGSLPTVPDVRGLIQSPRTLVWLDCQEEDKETDAHDFLSPQERTYLQEQGAEIPDFAQHLRAVRQERLRYLAKANEIILVRSAYHGTTRLGEHSLIAELKQLCGMTLPEADPESLPSKREIRMKEADIDTYQPQVYMELGDIHYKGRKESNTSLDTLIRSPFDYMMEYVARLRKPNDEQLKYIELTQGEVAHHFFQYLIEDSDKNFDKMRQLTHDEFAPRLQAAIDAKGLILRASQNVTRLNEFRYKLKESMLTLIDIMQELSLTPVGCELNFPGEEQGTLKIPTIGDFNARIDLLLQKQSGEYVIFDFKWSQSLRYTEKLLNNQAIQLELYRQAVQAQYTGKHVVGVGYYLMPQLRLVTSDFNSATNKHIQHVEPLTVTTPLFQQIQKAYSFRMKELEQGHIEEAEGMDMTDIEGCYIQQTEARSLCPIHKAVKKRLIKPESYDHNYSVLKGRLR